jgi:hypothetical protein
MFLCTIEYDAKNLQVNKDKKLQNKQKYKIAKHLQSSKNKIIKSIRVEFYFQKNYNKPCTTNQKPKNLKQKKKEQKT